MEVYTFNYWWNDKIDLSPINIAVSFFSFGISAMLIANFLTKQLIAPKKTGYSFFIIDEDKFKKIIENIGKEKYQNIKLKNSLLFCTERFSFCFNLAYGSSLATSLMLLVMALYFNVKKRRLSDA